jgi:uncharacterized spore protein YtfJ
MKDELQRVYQPIEETLNQLNVGTVFGEATKEGDTTIIPLAEVSAAFGYGYGSGEREEGEAAGGGGGGGVRAKAKPVGYLKITPDGVSFEPTFNPTLIPLAGIALSAWLFLWLGLVARALLNRKR